MNKDGFFRSFWAQNILIVLVGEAVIVGLAWVMHRYWSIMKGHYFSDGLLILGTLALLSAAMILRERREGERSPWSPRFAVIGVLAILTAIILARFSI